MTSTSEAGAAPSGFRHEAFFYADDAAYLAGTVPLIRAAIAAGEPVLVAVPRGRLALLRAALGPDPAGVELAAMEDIGANPGRIISRWHDFVEGHRRPGVTLRGIGEPVWAGRDPEELAECQYNEELLNLAFAAEPAFQLRCPYDVGTLTPDVVAEARRSHPHLVDAHGTHASETYEVRTAPRADGLSLTPAGAASVPIVAGGLAEVRRFVEERGRAGGLDPTALADFVLAVSEIASNSLFHADGGKLDVWVDDRRVVAQVSDRGRIDDPLVGRHRAPPTSPSGRGVWLAYQLCDLVQVRSSSEGSTIRLMMDR